MNDMQIQWYPGHMTKARRAMQEDLKLVDLVMELTDARAPLAGRNPDIDKLAAGKARMIFLNKADLADDQATLAWMDYFRKKGITPIRLDARKTNFKKGRDVYFYTTVFGTSFCCTVVGYRLIECESFRGDSVTSNPVSNQEVGNSFRAFFGDSFIHGAGSGVVRVTVDRDVRFRRVL